MNRMFATIILGLGFSTLALGGIKVTSLDLNTTDTNGFINIAVDGRSSDLPSFNVMGKVIEVTLDQAEPFVAINKTIRGAHLSANSVNGKAIVRVMLPYAVSKESVDLAWQNKKIEIIYSKSNLQKDIQDEQAKQNVNTVKSGTEVSNPASSISKEQLNESYLNSLMNDKKETNKVSDTKKVLAKDEIKVQQSATNRNSNNTKEFSFAGYAIKFTVFLAMVLGLFYGVVQLLKKGVFKRGKLGFLNNTQMIEVLSTTYVSPKRSLMIVKAHKQIFLVANSENGLEFLSEMKDTAGLIKEGEKVVTGTNFDSTLDQAAEVSETLNFKLKENIEESTPVNDKKSIADLTAKDIVKFSDELKKKARKLKPIEFNQ